MKKLLGYLRGWKDSIRGCFLIAKSDKVDTSDAFLVYGGSALPTGIWFADKMLKHPVGYRMLLGPTEMTANALGDLDRLKKMPAGSLGWAYAQTLTGMYKDGYDIELHDEYDIRIREDYGHQDKGNWTKPEDGDDQKIAMRLMGEIRWQHDLLHVLLGYQPDIAGEIGVTAFSIPHVHLPAPKMVTLIWVAYRTIKFWSLYDLKVAWEAWQIGRNTKGWVFPVDWETYLTMPIHEVRAALGIRLPVVYKGTHDEQGA